MTLRFRIAIIASAVLLPLPAIAQQDGEVPLESFRLVHLGGIDARAEHIRTDSGRALQVTFSKDTPERRMLAVAAEPARPPIAARSIHLDSRLDLSAGDTPTLAIVLFDADGGRWYQQIGYSEASGEFATVSAPVGALAQAAFSHDDSGELEWHNVRKAWLALVFEGKAQGTFTIRGARLSARTYKPDRPLKITQEQDLRWQIEGQEKSVEAKLTTPNEGPNGGRCMKLEFVFPSKGHKFLLPAHPVPMGRAAGYSALQFAYTAQLPEGIPGVLVQLRERDGSVYYVDPPPPPTSKWKTITIPFDDFTLGGWSKDENGALDTPQIASVRIAVHGSPTRPGPGTIRAANVWFLP